MAANYPTSDPAFTNKVDGDTIQVAHVNGLQDEVIAIGSALRGTLAHNVTTSGQFVSATQFRALLYHNAVQALANATWTAMLFGAEDADVGAMHSVAVNTSRITVPTGGAGLYLLTATLSFASNATGLRGVAFWKNGAEVGSSLQVAPHADGTFAVNVTHTALVALTDADYVEVYGYQNSTGALNTGHAATRLIQNQFQAVRLF